MDFFAHQDRARRNTSLLVLLYALAVSGIIVSIYWVVRLLFASMKDTDGTVASGLWDAGLFAMVAVSVLALVLAGSLFKTLQLSQGGAGVARSLGGRPIAPDTEDRDERRLLNVVEEMALAAGMRLPLAELAVPALRMMPRDQYPRFRQTVQAMIEADEEINLFEFALSRMILRHVASAFSHPDKSPVRHRTLDAILPACRMVLAGLAIWGSKDKAEQAYGEGLRSLGQSASRLDADAVSLLALSDALDLLASASPTLKRTVMDACAACVLADGTIATEETELLRAMADTMDIPMPIT